MPSKFHAACIMALSCLAATIGPASRTDASTSSLPRALDETASFVAQVAPSPHDSVIAPSQTLCDPTILSSVNQDDPNRYELRGDRCEGMFNEHVGGDSSILLVSLTTGDITLDPSTTPTMKVTWHAAGTDSLQLRAYSLRWRTYYRMDTAQQLSRSEYDWPSTILAINRIKRSDIGLAAWINRTFHSGSRTVFIPISASERTHGMRLAVVSGVDFAEVYVEVDQLSNDGAFTRELRKTTALSYGFYPAHHPIQIELPEINSPGLYSVNVSTDVLSGGHGAASFSLLSP